MNGALRSLLLGALLGTGTALALPVAHPTASEIDRLIRQLGTLRWHAGWVLSVAFVPGERRALSCGRDGTVRLWDLEAGKEMRCYGGHAGYACGVAVSPDGRSAVSGGQDGVVRLWRLPP